MRYYFETFGGYFKDDPFVSLVCTRNIVFALFNSSPFSQLEKTDKEHHFIPKESFTDLDDSLFVDKYSFAVIHHRPDWFDNASSLLLTNFLKKHINICFCGHEHIDNLFINKFKDSDVVFLNSGCLFIKKSILYGSANCVILDDDGNITVRSFIYNKGDIRYRTADNNLQMIINKKVSSGFSDTYTITFKIQVDKDKHVNLKDVFETPYLYSNTSGNDDIDSLEGLVNFINEGNRIFIHGRSSSGKTILLNRLMLEFEDKKDILLLAADEITNNFTTCIENTYEKIYGRKLSFFDIKQRNTIILVDNIDKIDKLSKKEKFISFLFENFESFVVTSETKQKDFNNDEIKSIFGFTIQGFSLKQRNNFIEHICYSFNTLNSDDVELIKKAVSISLASCSLLDLTSPYLVFEITRKIIIDELYKQQNVSDAFSLIFINDVNNSIIECGRKEYLEDYLNVLSEIAFEVTQKQQSINFGFDLITRSIKKCKEEYKNIKLSNDEFISTFLDSGIICRVDADNYKISHNSVLSYLASRKICFDFKDGNNETVSGLYKNIEVGLNGDILLFVLYQLKETSVLFTIKNLLEEALNQYPEINLDTRNNPILRMKEDYGPETKQQAENKKEFIDRLDAEEKKKIEQAEKKEESALDKTNDDDLFIKTIQRALKLIEILSKAVGGFKSELKHTKRFELAHCAISSLLRVFFAIFDVSEKDAKSLHDYFEEFKEEKTRVAKNSGKREKEVAALFEGFNFENFMYDIMTTNLLNDMSYIAKVMSSNVSFEVIKELNSEDNPFCFKLFQLISYQQSGVHKQIFINSLRDINEQRDGFIGNKLLTNRVVRVFTITNSLNNSELSQLSSACGLKRQSLVLYQAKSLLKGK